MGSLLGEMLERLRYLQPTMRGLIRSLAAMERFEDLAFLRDCARRLEDGRPFPAAWRESLKADSAALGREESELLLGLGDSLGVTDLNSQLDAIACTREILGARLEQARSYADSHARLYRTMGVLLGLALLILFI